jgi:hypothetical protein
MMVVLCSSVQALGMAPSHYTITSDNFDREFSIRVINSEQQQETYLAEVEGILADYVELSEDTVVLNFEDGSLTYTLKNTANLPPGQHKSDVVLTPLVVSSSGKTVVQGQLGIRHTIVVNIPYPDSYLDGQVYVDTGEVDTPLDIVLHLANRGAKSTRAVAQIEVYDPQGELVQRHVKPAFEVPANSQDKYRVTLDTMPLQGTYTLKARIINGDQKLDLERTFNLGKKEVRATDLQVSSFTPGGIARLDLYVKNEWNQDFTGVYADTSITGAEGYVYNLRSNPIDIQAGQVGILPIFWDTTTVNIGDYVIDVDVHVDTTVNSYSFETYLGATGITIAGSDLSGQVIGGESTGNRTLLFLVLILFLGNVGWFVWAKLQKKKKS